MAAALEPSTLSVASTSFGDQTPETTGFRIENADQTMEQAKRPSRRPRDWHRLDCCLKLVILEYSTTAPSYS